MASQIDVRARSGTNATSRRDEPTFIDLFAGCGGLSLGLMEAGWRGLFGVERQEDAFKTLAENLVHGDRHRYQWPRWLAQEPWDIAKVLELYPGELKKLRNRVDLVCGGPPCQGFSFAGKRETGDPRNQLFRKYVEFVELVQPTVVLLENVPGFRVEHGKRARSLRGKNPVGRPPRSYAQRLRELLERTYYLDDGLVEASEFGVPQVRPRYFAVGVRKDHVNVDPGPFRWAENLLHGIRDDFLSSRGLAKDKKITAGQALRDLATRRRTNRLVPYEPDGTCRSPSGFLGVEYGGPGEQPSAFVRLMRKGVNGEPLSSLRLPRHTAAVESRFQEILDTCRKGTRLNEEDRKRLKMKKLRTVLLDRDKPALTVTTLPDDILHYSEPRILTVRESARLQSFPDWFEFRGKYTTGGARRKKECPRYTQVGNAVPPLVAEAWGVALRPLLKKGWCPDA